MGLEEKRMLKQIKEEVFPTYEAELAKITGTPIAYEVDWDSFANNRDALYYLESRVFGPINEGFRDICRDDLGKEAVKESIKTIRVKQVKEVSDHLVLNHGVVEVYCDLAYGYYYPAEMISERLSAVL
jgi:hypothetical protein